MSDNKNINLLLDTDKEGTPYVGEGSMYSEERNQQLAGNLRAYQSIDGIRPDHIEKLFLTGYGIAYVNKDQFLVYVEASEGCPERCFSFSNTDVLNEFMNAGDYRPRPKNDFSNLISWYFEYQHGAF